MVYAVIQEPKRFGIEGENIYGISMNVSTDLALASLQSCIILVKGSPSYVTSFQQSFQVTLLLSFL